MRTFLSLTLLLVSSIGIAQSAKQIRSRNVREVTTITSTQNADKKETMTEIECYDKKGRLLSTCQFNPDSSSYKKSVFTYDKKGNKTGEIRYNTKQEDQATRWIFEYDVLGNLLLSTKSDASGMLQKTVYTYNNQGDKVLETVLNKEGSTVKKIEFQYDNTGLLIHRKTYDANGTCVEDKTMNYTKE